MYDYTGILQEVTARNARKFNISEETAKLIPPYPSRHYLGALACSGFPRNPRLKNSESKSRSHNAIEAERAHSLIHQSPSFSAVYRLNTVRASIDRKLRSLSLAEGKPQRCTKYFLAVIHNDFNHPFKETNTKYLKSLLGMLPSSFISLQRVGAG
jgi:hypothetical protein